jgi:hypothetical protein
MATSGWRTILRPVTMRSTGLAVVSSVFLALAGCGGRTGGDPSGGAPDAFVASSCAATCPAGCCDAQGRCQSGDATDQCGSQGLECQNCASAGYTSCDSREHVCVMLLATCEPSTCLGCCMGDRCYPGTSSFECGSGGAGCTPCADAGLACVAHACVASSGQPCKVADAGAGAPCRGGGDCGPGTCPGGCCDSNGQCQGGSDESACGTGGLSCQTCGQATEECINQVCAPIQCPDGCPGGCCDSNGACNPGISTSACINGSFYCQDCSALGGQQCINKVCANPDAGTCLCPLGCCDALNQCHPGASNTECGFDESSCMDCSSLGSGFQCVFQSCEGPLDAGVCNESSCPSGCCDVNGVCQPGLTNPNCGVSGTNCQNCLAAAMVCSSQQCVWPDGGPACDGTCPGCCNAQGQCQPGNTPPSCGYNGGPCLDCTNPGETCNSGVCVALDGAIPCVQASCSGCCDVDGNCRLGYTDTQCGQNGGACQDCTALTPPSTCDLNVPVRTCASEQNQCPGPYTGCPAALQQVAPAPRHACPSADLGAAAAACVAGASTDTCGAFASAEASANNACAECLGPFLYDFVEGAGVRTLELPRFSGRPAEPVSSWSPDNGKTEETVQRRVQA